MGMTMTPKLQVWDNRPKSEPFRASATSGLDGPQTKCSELASHLADFGARAVPILADILHLDAAIAILRGSSAGPRMRAQHRPEWFANLGRLILNVLRGAREPMTARAIAVEIMPLAGSDMGDNLAVQIVEPRVRGSLMRRVGIVERLAMGQRRKGWALTPHASPQIAAPRCQAAVAIAPAPLDRLIATGADGSHGSGSLSAVPRALLTRALAARSSSWIAPKVATSPT